MFWLTNWKLLVNNLKSEGERPLRAVLDTLCLIKEKCESSRSRDSQGKNVGGVKFELKKNL